MCGVGEAGQDGEGGEGEGTVRDWDGQDLQILGVPRIKQ